MNNSFIVYVTYVIKSCTFKQKMLYSEWTFTMCTFRSTFICAE